MGVAALTLPGGSMRRLLLIVLAVVVVLLVVGVVVLGAFPPRASSVPVQHVLPNDRFQTH